MPRLCEFYPGICLTTEEKARKNLSQGRKFLGWGIELEFFQLWLSASTVYATQRPGRKAVMKSDYLQRHVSPPVRIFVCNNTTPMKGIFVKYHNRNFYSILSTYPDFPSKRIQKTDTLQDDRFTFITFGLYVYIFLKKFGRFFSTMHGQGTNKDLAI